MVTKQTRSLLREHIQNGNAAEIHKLMGLLSAADQKNLKTVLAQDLNDGKKYPMELCLKVYVELLQLDLNKYFSCFHQATQNYVKLDAFWENLDLLDPLGKLICKQKTYYEEKLLDTMVNRVKPGRDVIKLFRVMHVKNRKRLSYLINSDSLYGYYQFLKVAQEEDPNPLVLLAIVNSLSFYSDRLIVPQRIRENVEDFFCLFFDLPNVLSVLRPPVEMDPTQLDYAEKSYENFVKVIVPANRIEKFLDDIM